MVREIQVCAEEICTTVVISDEPEALLAAQAAGRAIIGVEGMPGAEGVLEAEGMSGVGGRFAFAPYIAPGWEYVDGELAELAARRFLGLPWIIGETKRLLIRELRAEDWRRIPEAEELSEAEELFRDREKLAAYIRAQYGFYEYGTWAVVRREDGELAGLAGVSQPRLPGALEEALEEWRGSGVGPAVASAPSGGGVPAVASAPAPAFLELGYRVFSPFRGRGYAGEACREILEYVHEVQDCRVCALIAEQNKASRRLAESLGMKQIACQKDVTGTDTGSSGPLLLYAESCRPLPDRRAPW